MECVFTERERERKEVYWIPQKHLKSTARDACIDTMEKYKKCKQNGHKHTIKKKECFAKQN